MCYMVDSKEHGKGFECAGLATCWHGADGIETPLRLRVRFRWQCGQCAVDPDKSPPGELGPDSPV